LIEETAYAADNKFFIKHCPVAERADFVQRLAGKAKILATDYTSFELHANALVQRAVELQFYKYMLREIPEAREFLETHSEVATRNQKLKGKYDSFKIPACRMSGETCTSLGNGITNLVLTSFVVQLYGGKVLDAIVEGDDGLFAIEGHVPSEADFRKCGCKVKMQVCDDLSSAGFCSMYFVEAGDRRVMMRAAPEKLAKFGWSMSALRFGNEGTRMELLRGAAFALAAELGSCPIFWAVADGVLRDTMGYVPRFDTDGYHRYTASTAVAVRAPSYEVRAAYAQQFGLTVEEQFALECEIRSFGLGGPLVHQLCWTVEREAMWEHVRDRRVGQPVSYAMAR